jgi:glyoxylase-like metal-dependent hydrolase (beta-lactamase superfamily II)
VVQTPGHTLESICFQVSDQVLLTGDTLFINAVGRPDLKAANQEEALMKANRLYQSLQKILAMGDHYMVLPAHTSQPVEFDHIPIQATIGEIKKEVPILQLNGENFEMAVLQRIPPTPPNYLQIVEKNLKGDFDDVNPVDLEAGANRCAVS